MFKTYYYGDNLPIGYNLDKKILNDIILLNSLIENLETQCYKFITMNEEGIIIKQLSYPVDSEEHINSELNILHSNTMNLKKELDASIQNSIFDIKAIKVQLNDIEE